MLSWFVSSLVSALLDTAGGPFGLAASRRTGMVRSNEVEFLICRVVPKETETYIYAQAASLDKRHPPGTVMTKLHDGLLANPRPGFVLSSCVGTQSHKAFLSEFFESPRVRRHNIAIRKAVRRQNSM